MKYTRFKNQEGQALLLIVMLLATVITVVMTVAFKSTTDTQITKLEEQSQKGLSAAEAGIEQALNSRLSSGSVPITYPNFTGTATIVNNPTLNNFVSPLIAKDQQYTYYLAPYTPANADPFNVNLSYTGPIHVYYDTQTGNCHAINLEITVYFGATTDSSVRRYVADLNNLFGSGHAEGNLPVSPGTSFQGTTFNCEVNFVVPPQARLMFIRPFLDSTRIGVQSDFNNHLLPVQGKVITSTASDSSGGVTKSVQLFQSYPQIPSDFFVTQF